MLESIGVAMHANPTLFSYWLCLMRQIAADGRFCAVAPPAGGRGGGGGGGNMSATGASLSAPQERPAWEVADRLPG